ncbi:TonB-dependent receptor [Agriterribacter sp.]|uniref:TonB-dependent receptor n=1 Tax=Agriterribacter sp. TaxID=2821509 RepID=UPI002CC0CACA|nr:TonB-dependent receptor [Agriterribacter sp.]HTN08309.1 TonB-dependent receptor [Agriterribacter sp.]
MTKPLCLTVLLVIAVHILYAQTAIEGKVIDAATHQPLGGVTVSVLNDQAKTVTDKEGNFKLYSASKQDSIRFTSAGYESSSIPVFNLASFVLLTPSFASLNEIVVSGSRSAQRRTEVPVAIHVISKSAINDTKATRLDMLVNKIPGVFMVDLGNEQHSMAMRQPMGTKNLFLYLEDGIPIRTVGDFNHNALIEINQASLQRIEVIKGPASSLYGSEAVGGAINFITQAPSPFLSGKIQVEAGSRGYKRTDFNISNTHKKLGLYAGGYYARQDEPAREHNDFEKTALTWRADYGFSNRLKLTAVADYIRYKTDQKGGLDSAHFYSKDYTSFYRFTYRKVDALRLRTTLYKEWNDYHKTNLTIFYRNSAIGQNPFYSISNIAGNTAKAKGQINEDAFSSYGMVLQHTAALKFVNARFISGVSMDYSPATYYARFTDIDRDANGTYYNYTAVDSLLTHYNVDLFNSAIYTQLEYRPAGKLKVVAAARYDRLDYRFNNHLLPGAYTGAPDATDHFDNFTPKLGITYDFGKNKGAYINYSVGFAPPNITDLYSGVQVPVLKAASYHNYEAGGWMSFATGKGYAELSVYKLNGKNEMVSVRLADGFYQNQNTGKTSHKGIEVNVKYTPVKDIAIRAAGSYAEHRYINYIQQGKDFSGNRMAQAPAYIYNSEITYRPRYCKGFRIAAELQGMSNYYTDPQNTATYKGFAVFNIRAGYGFRGFELWTNCLNVANKVYAVTVEKSAYGTAYRPGQLRTVNIGLSYSFSNKE